MAGQTSLTTTFGLVAMAGFTGVSLGSCDGVEYIEALETAASVREVVVSADIGAVRIVGADRETAYFQRAVDGWKDEIALSSRVEDGVLYLEARCTGWLHCQVDTEVEVPADAKVTVSVGEGEVALYDLSGEVSVSIDTGALLAEGMRASSLSLSLVDGDGLVQFDASPESIDAQLASGDLYLELPGPAVDGTFDLAGGALALDGVENRPGAGVRVDIGSAGGAVNITRF
jgi:hypothetical protein